VIAPFSVQGYINGRAEVYPHMYTDGDFPPNTRLVVAGLVSEDYLVEVKAVVAVT